MLWVLSALDGIGGGPPAVFLFNIAAYWLAIAFIARKMASWTGTLVTLALLGLLPISLICLPHVWIDVLMAVILMMVAAILFTQMQHARVNGYWLFGATVLLFFASIIRHNAIFALAPLCVFVSYLALRSRFTSRWAMIVLGAVLFAIIVLFYVFSVRASAQKSAETWSVTPIWDLQAISIKTGRVLIPEPLHGPGLTVEELRDAFRPVDAAILYAKNKTPFANPTEAFTPEQRESLRRAWVDAVIQYPEAYLSHRLYVTQKLLGAKRNHEQDGTSDLPGFVSFRDNPPVAIANPQLNAHAGVAAEWLKGSTLLAPAWWLFGATFVVLAALRRNRRELHQAHGFALTLIASAWLYLTPLFVLSPNADLRYSLWPVIACVLGALVVMFAPRKR
jgi:Ca2+/Na+ antiporter